MYTLYGSPGTASLAPHCMLEQVGAPYTFVPVDISGETRDPAYLKLNPHGRVPTLIVNGKPVFESAAICVWLADRYPQAGLAPAVDAEERALYMQWMMYLTNTVQENLLQFLDPHLYTTHLDETPHIVDKARMRVDTAFGVIEKALKDQGPYLLGGTPSAADIYLSMLAGWYEGQEAFARAFPMIEANRKQLALRPGMARALAVNG